MMDRKKTDEQRDIADEVEEPTAYNQIKGQQSENLYRTLAEAARDIIFIIDREDIVEYANSYAAKMLGLSPEEIIGKKRMELFPPEIAVPQKTNLQIVFDTEKPVYAEGKILIPGGIMWLGTNLVPLYDSPGEVRAVLGISRDITERKQAEDTLRESEARYRSLFEHSPIALWEEDCSEIMKFINTLRKNGVRDFNDYFNTHIDEVVHCAGLMKIIDVNKASLTLFKSPRKKELLRGLYNVFTEKSFESFKEQIIALTQGRTSHESEASVKTLTGEQLYVRIRWSVVPGHEEDYSKVLISIIDISDRKLAEESLKESEARYRSFFEDSPIALFEEDSSRIKDYIDGLKRTGVQDFRSYFADNPDEVVRCAAILKVVDVNKASLSLFKAEGKARLIGSLDRIFSDSSYNAFREELVAIAEGRTSLENEHVAKTLTGDDIHIRFKWSVAPGHEDTYAKVLVSIIDISRQRSVEKLIRESEEKYRNLVELTTDVIYISDRQGNQVYMNKAGYSLLEVTPEEVIGKPWSELIHPDDRDRSLEKFMEMMDESIDVFYFENRYVSKSGKVINVSHNIRILRNAEGEIIGAQGIARDITYQKRVEKELSKRARLGELGKEIGEALTHGDTLQNMLQQCSESLVQHLNAAFARIWTFNPAENMLEMQASAGMYTHIDGRHSRVPLGTYKVGQIAEQRVPVMTNRITGDPWIHDQEWAIREGLTAFAGYPLIVEDRLVGVMIMFSRTPFTDFTLKALSSVADNIALGIERKHGDEAISRYARELEESNRVKELFGDILQHDLANPLNITSNYLEILLESEKDPEKSRYLTTARRNLTQIFTLLERVVRLSKLESMERIAFENLDLKEVIGNVVENLNPLASQSGMIIENTLVQPMPVRANIIIEEVFSNFISNAIKYAPPGTKVQILGRKEKDSWIIRIIDFGEGIKDDEKARIFERFHSPENNTKGTGLGLAIARRIIQLHNGSVWVEDNPVGGSIFAVELRKA